MKWSGKCPANKHGLDFRGQRCSLCNPTGKRPPPPATDPEVAEMIRRGDQARDFAAKARERLQGVINEVAAPAAGSGQLNALADILEHFSQGFRRLADLAHAQENRK